MATRALPSVSARTGALPDPLLVAFALLAALILPDPAGYVGGGGDDWYYVEAARCAAAQGWCVPETHWAARWPLVAPMGAAFAAFGDGRAKAALVPLAYTLAAIALFVRLLEVSSGRAAALVGGIAFVTTASIAKGTLQPNVETVELAWLLASAGMGWSAWRRRDVRRALLAGVLLGIAAQARLTTLAWLPIALIALPFVPSAARRLMLVALGGFALPLGGEMALYAWLTGDPFHAQQLSAAHSRIASSELPAWIDTTRSPILNPAFIGGWTPAMGIEAHWTVQGALNLFANPQMGPVLLAALVLLVVRRRALDRQCVEPWLALAAMLYAGALIYGLAIDPKARMFLPVAAIAAALIGRLGVAAWRAGDRAIVGTLLIVLVVIGTIETAKRFDLGVAGPRAAAWAAERPGAVAIEDATRRFLTLTPGIAALPVWPEVQRPHVLVLVAAACAQSAPARNGAALVRQADYGRAGDPLMLCEFRVSDRAAPLLR